MKTLYRMAWYKSHYADKQKGDRTDTYMGDIRETVADAVAAYYEDCNEDPVDAALKPEEFLIFVISFVDDLEDDDEVYRGTIEDIIPLEKAYSEGKAE